MQIELTKSQLNRFRNNTSIVKHTGCWQWHGCMNTKAIGFMKVKGKPIGAAKIAWMLAGNELPDNARIRHTCKITICINPAHMKIMTKKEREPKHPKVDSEKRKEILLDNLMGTPHREIARKAGIPRSTVKRIIYRQNLTISHFSAQVSQGDLQNKPTLLH